MYKILIETFENGGFVLWTNEGETSSASTTGFILEEELEFELATMLIWETCRYSTGNLDISLLLLPWFWLSQEVSPTPTRILEPFPSYDLERWGKPVRDLTGLQRPFIAEGRNGSLVAFPQTIPDLREFINKRWNDHHLVVLFGRDGNHMDLSPYDGRIAFTTSSTNLDAIRKAVARVNCEVTAFPRERKTSMNDYEASLPKRVSKMLVDTIDTGLSPQQRLQVALANE